MKYHFQDILEHWNRGCIYLKTKGNITVIMSISVLVISLLLANIFTRINSSIILGDNYKSYAESNLMENSAVQSSLAYLESNAVVGYKEVLIDGRLVKFSPIKVELPLEPDYNDPEFNTMPLQKSYLGAMNLTTDKFFNVNEYRDYLFYLHEGELMLFAAGTNNLGKSQYGGFLLKKTIVNYYGFGEYSFVEFKGNKGYVIGLSQWSPYKFNGIYKIEIQGESEVLLAHKIDGSAQLLIKIKS